MAFLAERFGEIALLGLGMAWVAVGFRVLVVAGLYHLSRKHGVKETT
jgi:hypothetical protein